MKDKKKISGLYRQMLLITILPLICMGVVIMAFFYKGFEASMQKEVKNEMKNMAFSIEEAYDSIYPGDYMLVGENYLAVVKGESVLNGHTGYIDSIHKESSMEISLFYEDARILTTLTDGNGERIVGSTAHTIVINDVLKGGRESFYPKADIGGSKYFAYYKPICNSDGSVVGMIELGKPASDIDRMILKAVLPILIIVAAATILVAFITFSYATGITKTIKTLDNSLNSIAAGNLTSDMDAQVLKREDELGHIANSIKYMQKELKNLVEQDALTGIANRRSGEKYLRSLIKQSAANGTKFVVVIGDIDLFKKVNDTFGHEGGDTALKGVAAILKKNVKKSEMAARWGGEEFLIVFRDCTLSLAYERLENILEEIRNTEFDYTDRSIRVTMTFGMQEGSGDMTIETLVRLADELLYKGKQNGRNQICTSDLE